MSKPRSLTIVEIMAIIMISLIGTMLFALPFITSKAKDNVNKELEENQNVCVIHYNMSQVDNGDTSSLKNIKIDGCDEIELSEY